MLALIAAAIPAWAAERATLTNGFSIDCTHHSEVGGKVRLYTSRDARSYIEFPAAEVAGIEAVPDPPATKATANPAVAAEMMRPEKNTLTAADLHQILDGAGRAHNLDVDLLASVVKAESGGNPRAVSRAGARGLMQLMPGTAAELGVQDSYLPDQNVGGGSAYLDGLLTRYHDNLAVALAAYNAGPAAVDKYHGIPPYRETRLYVARVIHEFNWRVRERERTALAMRGR
jgi:soluble lytic murein transglycosylase-like protein